MIIEYDSQSHETKRAIKFGDLQDGEVFRKDDSTFIKTNQVYDGEIYNTIALNSGLHFHFSDNDFVDRVLIKSLKLCRDDFTQWYEDLEESRK